MAGGVVYQSRRTRIRQIARTTKMTDLEIRRIVYGLLQAGLVEIVRPAGRPAPAARPGRRAPADHPSQHRTSRKSLINRLINRIRSI